MEVHPCFYHLEASSSIWVPRVLTFWVPLWKVSPNRLLDQEGYQVGLGSSLLICPFLQIGVDLIRNVDTKSSCHRTSEKLIHRDSSLIHFPHDAMKSN